MIQKGDNLKSVCHDSLLYQITKTTPRRLPAFWIATSSIHGQMQRPRGGRERPIPFPSRRRAGLRSRWHPPCKPESLTATKWQRAIVPQLTKKHSMALRAGQWAGAARLIAGREGTRAGVCEHGLEFGGRWHDLQTTSTAKWFRNGQRWCDRSPPWAGPRFFSVWFARLRCWARRWALFPGRQGCGAPPYYSRRARQQTSVPKRIWAPTRPGPNPGVFGGTWARRKCLHSH